MLKSSVKAHTLRMCQVFHKNCRQKFLECLTKLEDTLCSEKIKILQEFIQKKSCKKNRWTKAIFEEMMWGNVGKHFFGVEITFLD